jgi:hypothetical protein
MKLKISSIADIGDNLKERLVLKVLADTDIGEYAIFCADKTANNLVSTEIRKVFWFPDKPVKAGDIVVVYTKTGNSNERVNKDNTTSYFYYWGIASSLWSTENVAAVVLHVDEWISNV